jgi:restriction endonuclease S subunit
VTTAKEFRTADHADFTGKAICIPLVSSTGHGHASINRIHYVNGAFAAATIIAVIQKKPGVDIELGYIYRYLSTFKDEVLVPLMQGAANVSLSVEKIENIRIPLPSSSLKQKSMIEELDELTFKIESLRKQLSDLEEDMLEECGQFRREFTT